MDFEVARVRRELYVAGVEQEEFECLFDPRRVERYASRGMIILSIVEADPPELHDFHRDDEDCNLEREVLNDS